MPEIIRRIDSAELLGRAKKVQQKLYAEDYDEILSYEDLEELVGMMAEETEDGETGNEDPFCSSGAPSPEGTAFGPSSDGAPTLEKICDMADYYDEVAKVKTTAHHLACAFTSFVFNELDGKVWAEPLEDALKDATLLKDGHFHDREHYHQCVD